MFDLLISTDLRHVALVFISSYFQHLTSYLDRINLDETCQICIMKARCDICQAAHGVVFNVCSWLHEKEGKDGRQVRWWR